MKQIVIIGGGSSIKPELDNGLWDKLKGKFTIGCNYSYKFFQSTIQCFVDHKFYTEEVVGLKDLPLIIGNYHANLNFLKKENTILLPSIGVYTRNVKRGVYKASLVGIFALTLATCFLEESEIYLLGYDLGADKKDNRNRFITHFYQSTKEGSLHHRGIGKVGYYKSRRRSHYDFGCFKEVKGVKIYNVSPESKLEEFEKITYKEFYKKLNREKLDQDKIRENILKKIKE